MTLRELIANLPRVTAAGPLDVEISGVTNDSRNVTQGSLFAAVRGEQADGHQFIAKALAAGAAAILAESAPPLDHPADIPWLHVADSRAALATLASVMAGKPWAEMAMIGVTGTNGKTTTAFLVHHLMKSVWHRAGLLGTVQVDDGTAVETAHCTTPDALELEGLLARMRGNDCRGVSMEVSSHGIDQFRVGSIGFDAAIFTNLTQDHLDYHGTMEHYFDAKKKWFLDLAADPLGKKPVAVVNTDDAYGEDLVRELDGRLPVVSFGFNVHATFRANNLRQSARGMEFELSVKSSGKSFLVRAPLIGRFNCYNLLGAIAAANACGIRMRDIVAAIAEAPQVPGRMENVGNAAGATVFVDYAHTPDALKNACRTLRELNPKRLITVFGCGGDRDRTKRPLMGAAASELSDACILTSDNPRSEDPNAILAEIERGVAGAPYKIIADRDEAIRTAVMAAHSGDIVLIAGKGHETYQEAHGERVDFDDRKQAAKALRERSEAANQKRP